VSNIVEDSKDDTNDSFRGSQVNAKE
jgi:hypothetical protein